MRWLVSQTELHFRNGVAASATDGAAWGSQAFSSYTFYSGGAGPAGVVTDATTIACSFNIFNQNDIYRLGNFNGWCLNPGQTNTVAGYDIIPTFVSCIITFAASAATGSSSTKSDKIIGQWQGQDIESITIVDDPEERIEVPGYAYDESTMLPVNIVKRRGFRRMPDGTQIII